MDFTYTNLMSFVRSEVTFSSSINNYQVTKQLLKKAPIQQSQPKGLKMIQTNPPVAMEISMAEEWSIYENNIMKLKKSIKNNFR